MSQPNQTTSASYASIMVPIDLSVAAERRLKLATELADRFSSRIVGIAAQQIAMPLYFEAAAPGIASIIELEEKRAAEEFSSAEAMFRRVTGTRNDVEWRQALRFPVDYILEQARAADLIVVDRPQQNQDGPMSFDSGSLVMSAGRPVLFVPPRVEHLSAKRVVVAWKDTREARRAVWDSLPLLKAAQDVYVVSVDDDSQSAKDVSAYLTRHGATSSVVTRRSPLNSIAEDIVRVADAEGADLVVCGAYGHSRAREWAFGGVTRDLLDHSPLCCLMAH